MKNIKILLITTLLTCTISHVFAAGGSLEGQVEYIRVNSVGAGAEAPPVFWFTLDGVTAAGSCSLWNGKVVLMGNSDQMLTMVLAAQMGRKALSVYYDDTVLINGKCQAQFVSTSSD